MSKAGQWLLTLLFLTEVLWPDRERSLRECHQMSPLSERDHCTQATPRGRFVRVAVRPMSSHLKWDSRQQTQWILHVKNWNARGDKLIHLHQVWLITQFYSIDFSKSRNDVKKCVFNKRTIKVCISCYWECPGTSISGSNTRSESRALEVRRVSSKSPSRVRDGDEGVAGRNGRE